MSGSVLIIEDEASLSLSLAIALKREGFTVAEASTLATARELLAEEVFSVILTDLRLPDGDGLSVVRLAKTSLPDTSVIVMSAYGTIDSAVEATRLGALDFLEKPFDPARLLLTVRRAIEHRSLLARVREVDRAEGAPELVGVSPAINAIRRQITQAATSRSVLILGETGTGKELVARAVHAVQGERAPFIVVSAESLGESVIDSELFGHVAGAFPGALAPRRGLLREADGGTVFFDEITDVPFAAQAKILRFLQSGEVKPLGADRGVKVRARVAAATAKDLATEMAAGRFREDLYFRLDVFRIQVPPLRERVEDIRPLADHMLQKIARDLRRPLPTLLPSALDRLMRHSWPGNVRELTNALERAVLAAQGPELSVDHLPELGANRVRPEPPVALESLGEVERRHILRVLDLVGGDRSRAIATLGISKSTLRRKLIEYGLWNATTGDGSDEE